MDRSIKIIQQFEQVFEPYHMMFRELTRGEISYDTVSEKKRKTHKKKTTKMLFLAGGH